MPRQTFLRRFISPLFLMVGLWILFTLAYNNAWRLEHGLLRTLAINTSGPLLFLSIWFFSLLGPSLAFIRGARFIERLIIAFAVPVLWIIFRVESRIACQYDFVEMIYFLFLPWLFGLICVTLFNFSLADLICRLVARFKGYTGFMVWHPGILLLLVIGAAGIYAGLLSGQNWVYMVVHYYAEHHLGMQF